MWCLLSESFKYSFFFPGHPTALRLSHSPRPGFLNIWCKYYIQLNLAYCRCLLGHVYDVDEVISKPPAELASVPGTFPVQQLHPDFSKDDTSMPCCSGWWHLKELYKGGEATHDPQLKSLELCRWKWWDQCPMSMVILLVAFFGEGFPG